jgi:hypothetical protein
VARRAAPKALAPTQLDLLGNNSEDLRMLIFCLLFTSRELRRALKQQMSPQSVSFLTDELRKLNFATKHMFRVVGTLSGFADSGLLARSESEDCC